MENWIHVNAGYDPGDETLNFGTRAFAEAEGYIYEISTYTTIKAETEVQDIPYMCSESIPTGGVCLSIDSSLYIFEDPSCTVVKCSNAFDSRIDAISCSSDGRLLFVGLSNGFIHCLHVHNDCQHLFSKKLNTFLENCSTFLRIICEEKESCAEVFAVFTSGVCVSLQNIDVDAFHCACMNKNMNKTFLNELASKIVIEAVTASSSIAPIESVTFLKNSSNIDLLAVGKGIATVSLQSGLRQWNESPMPNSSTLIRVEYLPDRTLCFALSSKGQLMTVCPETLTLLPVLTSIHLLDFQLFLSPSSEIIIVGISTSQNGHANVVVISFQDQVEKFSLPVKVPVKLMCLSIEMEDIYFLECSSAELSSGFNCVAIKAAVQTNPKFRMDRMLNRKKFKDAKALAERFGLDMTPIHMAQVKDIIEKFQPWNLDQQANTTQALLRSLISELDNILDIDFVCKCCATAIAPDYNTAFLLLEYAQKRLQLFVTNNPELEYKVVDSSEMIFCTMLRLETMNLVHSCFDVDLWLNFCRLELVKEVERYLKQGDLLSAITIWSRHSSEIKPSLDNFKTVGSILECTLECIPPSTSLDELLPWLKHMLPVVLEVQPQSLYHVVAWYEKRICDLERSHFRSWPQVGLKYCENTLEIFRCQEMTGAFLGVECSPIRPLVLLLSDLKEIRLLKEKYLTYVSLEDYKSCRQEPTEIAALIMDRVDVNLLPSLIEGFLSKFLLDHKLLKDDIISHYILGVLQCSAGWWYWDSAPWEARISKMIPHISNLTLRLECIVKTLEFAPIPWSPTITSLAESGLRLKHPLSTKVREKQKLISTNLILKKYNFKVHIAKLDMERFIRHIIKSNRPEIFEDITQLARDINEKVLFYRMLLLYYVGNCNVEKASAVLRNLPKDVTVMLCPCIIPPLCQISDFSVESALEFLCAVELCYRAAAASRPAGVTFIEDLDNPRLMPLSVSQFRSMLYLKRDFGKTVSIDQMITANTTQMLSDCITELFMKVGDKDTKENKIRYLYLQTNHLATLLDIPQAKAQTVLVKQMLSVGSLSLAAHTIGYIEDIQEVAESFHQDIISVLEKFFTTYEKFIKSNDQQSGISLNTVAKETFNVLAKVCTCCGTETLQRILDVIGWIQCWLFSSGSVGENMIGQRNVLQQWRISPIYRDPGIAVLLDSTIIAKFMMDAYDAVCAEGNLKTLLELPERAQELQNNQHDLALYLIMSQLLFYLQGDFKEIDTATYECIHSSFIKISEVLLTKVVGARQLDMNLGLSLLLNLGEKTAINWLYKRSQSAYYDLNKLRHIACLGLTVCRLWNMPEQCASFHQLYLYSTWGAKLPVYGISCKDLTTDCEPAEIVKKLISSKTVSVSVIQSFCLDHGLDVQIALLEYLSTILLGWDPDLVITTNSDGSKDVMERNTQSQLFNQCWEVQKSIAGKKQLHRCLINLWEKVSFYHHEVFLVILDLLEKNGATNDINTKRLLTTFLKSYHRTKPPNDAEEEFWSKSFPASCGLPSIAQFRLPFNRLLLDNALSVVKEEINLDNYKNWLSLASALNLTKDRVCTIAVHQTITEMFPGTSLNAEWCETMKNEALFRSVAECVAQMDEIILATATLFFFVNKIPPGADQVEAAILCVKYAEEVAKVTGDTEYQLKVRNKFFTLQTTQLLHSSGLGQPCYLQLINQPKKLIRQLYQHPNIIETCQGTADHKIDINAVVEAICELHALHLQSERVTLVLEWLQPEPNASADNSLDEYTITGMSAAVKMEHQTGSDFCDIFSQNDDNLLRVRYIMESGDLQEWALNLLSLIFGEQERCTSFRLRALQCLCMLADDETLEELSGRTASSLRSYRRSLGYVRELERFGLAYSEPNFEACDKKELALLVIRTGLCRPRAISFLTNLCLDYHITHLAVWAPILQQMVDLAMMGELELLLPKLTNIYQLWNLTSFVTAWNLILITPFMQDVPQQTVFHALELFSFCPVRSSIRITDALECCLSFKQFSLVAVLIALMKAPEGEPWLKKLSAVAEFSELSSSIKDLPINALVKNKALNLIKSFENS